MLIVIEGLDGSGKSTQVSLLKDYITQKGLPLRYMHFPRYYAPVYGNLIAKFLRGGFGDISHVHPQLVALIYALDRADAAREMKEWLNDGCYVVLDRYVYSNIAYQCSKLSNDSEREELREWICNLEYDIYKIPRPDVNIFLDVPIDFVSSRLNSSRSEDSDRDYLGGAKDIHEENINFQIGVREEYLRQVERDADFLRIDCSAPDGTILPMEQIFDKIKSKVLI